MHRVLGKPLVTIERTTNMPLIRKILTDERVFGKMADDFAPPREQYEPLEHPEMIYLAVNGDQGVGPRHTIGFFLGTGGVVRILSISHFRRRR